MSSRKIYGSRISHKKITSLSPLSCFHFLDKYLFHGKKISRIILISFNVKHFFIYLGNQIWKLGGEVLEKVKAGSEERQTAGKDQTLPSVNFGTAIVPITGWSNRWPKIKNDRWKMKKKFHAISMQIIWPKWGNALERFDFKVHTDNYSQNDLNSNQALFTRRVLHQEYFKTFSKHITIQQKSIFSPFPLAPLLMKKLILYPRYFNNAYLTKGDDSLIHHLKSDRMVRLN